jgi:hypothetical protein
MRWVLVLVGVIVASSVIFLHLAGKRDLGEGFSRLYSLFLGVLSVLLAIGALFQSPIGWYAGAGLAIATALETAVRWQTVRGYEATYRAIWAAFVMANVALLAYLVTNNGRLMFGLDPL